MNIASSILNKMPDFGSWLTRWSCCQRQPQQAYIYLYSPTMSGSSSSLFRCLVCVLFGFCLAFVFILTAVVIHHLNSNTTTLSSESIVDPHISPIAKKRQLPDFVNTNIDPCEHFYDFVCDKWTRQEKVERHNRKWTRIRHILHDKLMVNISSSPPRSSASNVSASSSSSVSTFYQLCETQSPSLLLDELESSLALFIKQEPYRSYLTLINRTKSTTPTSSSISFQQYNPFFKIIRSSSKNQSFSTITRIQRRSIPSLLTIFPNLTKINQTALERILKFDEDYTKFLREANRMISLYNKEYSQESLLMKRILSFSDYKTCLPSANKTNGLQNLIQLLNHFLQYRLNHLNTKLIDKQIRVLNKITANHTLVEHLKRIRLEFKIIEQIIPLGNQINNNSPCITNLLDKLLDDRMTLDDLPAHINFYSQYTTKEYFLSSDWPYLIMLHDRLLKNIPADILVNYVFFDYYRHLVYPYYQPHIHRFVVSEMNYTNESDSHMHNTNSPNASCYVNSCFDILNCYHPSLLNQVIDVTNQIPLESVKTTVHNLIHRFRLLIEQSDHLFLKEKNLLLNELNQIKLLLGHYSTSFQTLPNFNSSSYFKYVQLFSSIPYDQHNPSYSTEPIYYPSNHTLFLPYGFLYLTNNSIEYPVIKILLEILSKSMQSNPFYIECLTKSFDEWNSTIIDPNLDHMIYLLYRSKFLSDENIILDEYLWPFMSANALMKRFLINYTANNYCHSSNASDLFQNNTYLTDDIHLVFHCEQASSIKQSKCSVN